MEKIRILAVSTSGLAQKEGISTVILDYFSRFDRERFALSMAAPGRTSPVLAAEFQAAGIRVVPLPDRKGNTAAYINALFRHLRREKYHAVYVHGSSAIMSIELGTALLCGCPIRIAHSHNTCCDHQKADRLLRPLFYRLYTDAFACGQAAGEWLFGGRPFRVVKNGRDVKQYRFDPAVRQEVRRELGLGEHTLAVGHVGHFTQQKNQAFALEIFQALGKIRPDSRLYLMGDGPMREEAEEKARRMGLSDRVVFTGAIGNVPRMLQAMDAMVLPSRHEGLPLVAVEWQIAALPCLLSDRITRECAYSDLVHFLPLEHPEVWAEQLVNAAAADRKAGAERMPELTARAGFDLCRSVEELQLVFLERMGRE